MIFNISTSFLKLKHGIYLACQTWKWNFKTCLWPKVLWENQRIALVKLLASNLEHLGWSSLSLDENQSQDALSFHGKQDSKLYVWHLDSYNIEHEVCNMWYGDPLRCRVTKLTHKWLFQELYTLLQTGIWLWFSDPLLSKTQGMILWINNILMYTSFN